jgi:C1A family cysteine protease
MIDKPKYGWIPDRYEPDYQLLHCGAAKPVPLSDFVSLIDSPHMPPIYDQKTVGSCTGNGTAAVDDFFRHKMGLPFLNPSRLAIYYGAREYEGTTTKDDGAQIQDAVRVAVEQGVAPETLWIYDTSKVCVKPDPAYYAEAVKHKGAGIRVSQADYYIGYCLEILKMPIVFGMAVFKEMESEEVAKTGIIPMPRRFHTPIGGHCMDIVERDVKRDVYGVRNSWGINWGVNGYGWVPRKYVLSKLASDFHTITAEAA